MSLVHGRPVVAGPRGGREQGAESVWEKCQRVAVPWADNREVATIEGREGRRAQSLAARDD